MATMVLIRVYVALCMDCLHRATGAAAAAGAGLTRGCMLLTQPRKRTDRHAHRFRIAISIRHFAGAPQM
jgi:hypothetical protein